MSTTANMNPASNPISDTDEVNHFQAARRNGRRNALPDLAEQIAQVNSAITTSQIDNLGPHLQSMSIQH